MSWSQIVRFSVAAAGFPLILALSPSGSTAGVVYGRLDRPAAAAEPAEIRRYRDASPATNSERADCRCNPGLFAVISLWPQTQTPTAPLPDTLEMVQQTKSFSPSVLAVTVNSVVSFPNLDPFFHNVFSYSKTKPFDLGKYEQGKTKYVTFDKPGIVQVFCEIHYSMRAYIHVLETPYFVVAEVGRPFAIDNVPEGTYRVRVWQEAQSDLEKTLTVEADSTQVTLP